jgi:hypothetical protein
MVVGVRWRGGVDEEVGSVWNGGVGLRYCVVTM